MVDPVQAHVPFLLRDEVGSGSPQRELDGLIASDPASESFLLFIFSKGICLMSHANPLALSDNPFPSAVNAFNQ